MEKVLSVCIGTYNRREDLTRNIDKLLSINSNEMEIVVVDNNSTDGTFEYLSTIKDSRLKKYKNEKNIGMAPNWKKAIDMSEAKYAMHLNDKDLIVVDDILVLISRLKESDAAFVKNSSSMSSGVYEESYKKGEECFKRFAYQCDHPTGYIFNKTIWNMVEDEDKENIFNKNNLYPYAFILARMALLGDGYIWNLKIWKGMDIEDYSKDKCKFKTKKESDIWYMPESRLKYYEMSLEDIHRNIPEMQQSKIYMKLYKYFLYLSTIRYINVTQNIKLVEHNGRTCEKVTKTRIKNIEKVFLKISYRHFKEIRPRNIVYFYIKMRYFNIKEYLNCKKII